LKELPSTPAPICTDDAPVPSDFDSVLSLRLSRRSLLKGGLAAATTTYLGSSLILSASGDAQAAAACTFLAWKKPWDVFLFAARSTADHQHINLSGLTADNYFSSPDGLWFARSGLLWIQTDDHTYRDVSNCMLLAAVPGKVGDGGTRTIVNRDEDKERPMTTHMGKAADADTLRRFLVGPVDCEITGLAESPDGRALFINIQHPGETTQSKNFNINDPASYLSHWPAGGKTRPRSATIVITRKDGGSIGADFM
jgi:secreted PhoX family phosphatase